MRKKSLSFFVLFVCHCWHLSCQISNESVGKIAKCSLYVLIYGSAVFKFFSEYYNNLHFYWAIINLNFIWNIDLNNGVYYDLLNESACLNTILHILQVSILLRNTETALNGVLILFLCRCWHLSCQIHIENVGKIVICSLNVLMTVPYLKFFSIL